MSKFAEEYSVYVGNLDIKVAVADLEELVHELFLQAGPVDNVYFPSDLRSGWHRCYAFVEFEHKESVVYAVCLLDGLCLHGRPLRVRMASKNEPASSTAAANGVVEGMQVAALPVPSNPTDDTNILNGAHNSVSPAVDILPMLVTPNGPQPLFGPTPQNLSDMPPLGPLIPSEAQHPTLGQRLSPNALFGSTPPNLSDMPPLGPLIPSEAQHPTLGQRLSPKALFGSTSLGQFDFPITNGAYHPTLGRRLSPPVFNSTPPIMYDANNNHYNHSPPPLHLPPHPLFHSTEELFITNSDTSVEFKTPHPLFPDHTLMHQDRVVHMDDKPSWMSQDTKQQIRDYHLLQLGETIAQYKQLFPKQSSK